MSHPRKKKPSDPYEPSYRHDPRVARRRRIDPFHASCPIRDEWHEWHFFNVPRRGIVGKGLVLHKLPATRDLGEIVLDWEVGQNDPGRFPPKAGERVERRWKSHIHTETTIDGHRVHIDWVQVERSGPHSWLIEARIFVDGVLAGQAWQGGCALGFGGGDFPAIARIGDTRAIVVDARRSPRPCVWLWEVAAPDSEPATGHTRLLGERDERMHRKFERVPEPEPAPEEERIRSSIDSMTSNRRRHRR